MPPVTVKFKRLRDGVCLPKRMTEGAACFDLFVPGGYTMQWNWIEGFGYQHKVKRIGLGFALEIPEGYEGVIRPRSSMPFIASVFSTIGTIDSDYRGEVAVQFVCTEHWEPAEGSRIAQLAIREVPTCEFVEVDELADPNSSRTGGFGSTGG